MIIHKYIQRITKDRGLIDSSEVTWCCKKFEIDFAMTRFRMTYEGVINNITDELILNCPHCSEEVKFKKHYVSYETLCKHMSKQFLDKVFI